MRAGLWRDHPATPRQEQLVFKTSRKRSRTSQADLIIEMLREKRALGNSLELPEIMAAGIAQHGARIYEIRSRGFVVVNETDRDGKVARSRYYLTFDPERDKSHESER
jgi:Helix-turn-helix domain